MASTDTRTPLFASGFMVLMGVLVGTLAGWKNGSIAGGVVSMLGGMPASLGAWRAMRAEEMGRLSRALAMIFLALSVGAFLCAMWVIGWIRS